MEIVRRPVTCDSAGSVAAHAAHSPVLARRSLWL